MAKVSREASYICIRENFSFNKHFLVGDPFPEEWIGQGYKPNQHFAPRATAYSEIEQVKKQSALYGPGDDPRSTDELKSELARFTKVPDSWPRKQVWHELRRYEAAEARDEPAKTPKKAGKFSPA